MFERDHCGLNPETQNQNIPGGVAPSRHALARQSYLEQKQVRLAGEAEARRFQDSTKRADAAAHLIWRMANAVSAFLRRIAIRHELD